MNIELFLKNVDTRIANLLKIFQKDNKAPLRQQVLLSYGNRTLKALQEIFAKHEDTPDKLPSALKDFLAANWNHTQGTFLSCTSTPDSELTQLLCDVAEFAAVKLNQKELKDKPVGAINLLMPTVNTESSSDEYPHLGSYESEATTSEGDIYSEMEFIPKVNDKLTPHTILKTHILSQTGDYLIPIRLLTAILVVGEQESRLHPYYNPDKQKNESVKISDEDKRRLIEHSSDTRALFDAFESYKHYLLDTSDLLGNLNQLCESLYKNSVNLLGTENKAGSGVDEALQSFREYYQTLGLELRKKIPEKVKYEIDILLAVTFNDGFINEIKEDTLKIDLSEKLAYRNAAIKKLGEVDALCIATRRQALLQAMKDLHEELTKITLSKETQEGLRKSAKNKFEEAKNKLIEGINKDNYTGHDELGLTKEVLDWLGIEVSITNQNDLRYLADLKPEDIKTIGKTFKLDKQIAAQFLNLEELVLFATATKPAALEAIISICSEELIKKNVLSTPKDLGDCLVALDSERVRGYL